MALADPDPPEGAEPPELPAGPPDGWRHGAGRYASMLAAWQDLPRRHRAVVAKGFGREAVPLDAAALVLGVGRERVRQIEHGAVSRLARALGLPFAPPHAGRDETDRAHVAEALRPLGAAGPVALVRPSGPRR